MNAGMKQRLLVIAACSVVLVEASACNKPQPEPNARPSIVEVAPDSGSATPETPEPVAGDGSTSSGDPVVPDAAAAPSSNMKACCEALAQNAKAAPPPTNGHLLSAAAACNATVATGKDGVTFLANLQSSLKGAEVPAACRRD